MFRNQILTAAVDQAVFGKVKPAVTMAEEKALPTDWLVMLPTDGEREVALKLMKDWICSSEICLPTYICTFPSPKRDVLDPPLTQEQWKICFLFKTSLYIVRCPLINLDFPLLKRAGLIQCMCIYKETSDTTDTFH